jgi:WD40 repeat protein
VLSIPHTASQARAHTRVDHTPAALQDVLCIAWSSPGDRLATGDSAGHVNVWSLSSRAVTHSLMGEGFVCDVQWVSEAGTEVAVAFGRSKDVTIADVSARI